ncbi:MAG: hypothetical protein CVT66_02035 [Actinobacteria bacterium HGW-Actinobacteria-6]|nr:MAG: hypothetical protein CVT66_02035 [Actinobacteria bacterium HGW-Actinobacteria-6]
MNEYPGQPLDMKLFQKTFLVCAMIPTILFMMTFVLWFMLEDPVEPGATVPLLQIVIFAAMAIAVVVFAPRVRAKLLRASGPVNMKNGVRLEGDLAAQQRISMAAIVGMGLAELPLLLGFVLGFLSMSWTLYIPFAALSVAGWAYMYPRPAQIRQWYEHQMASAPMPGTTN